MKQMWDDRYSAIEYAYGKTPNAFFKAQIDKLKPGKILLPAEGEGRNAVYAATQGWDVYAIDQSIEGQKKAIQLAEEYGVKINYELCDILDLDDKLGDFDLIALTYVHLPSELRKRLHTQLIQFLKPTGQIILEGFSINNLKHERKGEATNGPRNSDFLFSLQDIAQDFNTLLPVILLEEKIMTNEGKFHQGRADVVRFLGKKA